MIIAMTSWRKRISRLPETIANIHEVSPGNPVVLTLSRDEFPDGVPETGADEVIWVGPDQGPFKKILYAMREHPGCPVVSADDDAVYLADFAAALRETWRRSGGEVAKVVATNIPNVKTGGVRVPNGYCTYYPPGCLDGALEMLTPAIVATHNDDTFYGALLAARGYRFAYMHWNGIASMVDDGNGMGRNGMYRSGNADLRTIVSELRKSGKFRCDNADFSRKWFK